MADRIVVEWRYQKFLKDNDMAGLDKNQDWFLRRLFFAGFTSYRDLSMHELQSMNNKDMMLALTDIDEQLQEYWGENSKFEM